MLIYVCYRVWRNPYDVQHVPFWKLSQDEIRKLPHYEYQKYDSNEIEDFSIIYATFWKQYYIETHIRTEDDGSSTTQYCYRIYNYDKSFTKCGWSKIVKYLKLKSIENRDYLAIKTINTNQNCYDNYREKIIGKINPNKTFDKLYYDQKQTLINILKKFQTGTLYPSTVPMDNKLGILLYGPPGTGKTGTISAIANMLQRDIILVSCASLTTTQKFDLVLETAQKSKQKNIIVFDEFDCILDVILNPDSDNHFMEKHQLLKNWSDLLASAKDHEKKDILQMINSQKNKEQKLDLSYILSKLDGLEDNTDRLIIATTNNPDKINPSLLRPGRFDLKLCLSTCSKQMLVDILGNFFSCSNKDRLKIRDSQIPEFKYTPLEVINAALFNETLNKTIDALK